MASLFISHSSRDNTTTDRLARRLEAEGFAALFIDFDPDRGLPAGRSWERELYSQLRKTDAVVFLASRSSVASQWCFAEVGLARSLGKPVFPVRLERGVELPLLADVQWVDLTDGDGAVGRLLAGLREAGLDPSESFAWDPRRPPYPGLESFTADDAAVFFGRDREVDRLVELLQPTLQRERGRFVAIVGPSGSGKSSLLHAGLLPRLRRPERRWVVIPPMVPGSRPIEALARSWAASFAEHGRTRTQEELAAALDGGPGPLVELVRETADLAESRSVLVVVDQAEELLTRSGEREQRAFLATLSGALREDSPLWAVATVRSEFLSAGPERAGLTEVMDDFLVVEPLSRERLPEVITRPAQRAGIEFAPGLPGRMVEETVGGDALPLLAYTLRELYQRVGRDGLVSVADYEAMGGVVGALQRRSDGLLEELGRRGRGHGVVPTLLKLAAVNEEGEPTRRRLPRSALDVDERAVVDAFVDARLLTSSVGPDGRPTVEVAHEALLRQWPPLRQGIDAARSSLRIRSELERLASDWESARRDPSYLARGGRLAPIASWAAEHPGELGPVERQFLDASRDQASRELEAARRANRRLRMVVGALAAVLVAALVAGGLALDSSQEARSQTRLALSRQLAAQAGRLVDRQPDVAILVGLQSLSLARDEDPEPEAPTGLVAGLARTTHASRLLAGHTHQVHEVDFSDDGRLLASAGWDGTIRLWDARTGEPSARKPMRHGAEIMAVAFSPTGRMLASAGLDGSVRLWDVASGRPRGKPLSRGPKSINAIQFSRDGDLIASAGEDGSARMWETESGAVHGRPMRSGGKPIYDVEFSPDGELLATAGGDHTARLWDVESGRPRGRPIRGHANAVWGVGFSPDGRLLATASADRTARIWALSDGRPLGPPLASHGDRLWEAAFSRDGRLLATAGTGGAVRMWEVDSGRLSDQPLAGHTDTVNDVDFSPDGRRLASAGWDGDVRLWDMRETVSISRPLTGHDGEVFGVRSSPDGSLLASAGVDGTVRLWDMRDGTPHGEPLRGHQGEVNGVDFTPDGRYVASAGGDDDTVRLWDVRSGASHGPPIAAHQGGLYGIDVSPDGRLVATVGNDRAARLWDLQSRRPYGQRLSGHHEVLSSVAFSEDGNLLATGSADQDIRLWDVRSGDPRGQPLEAHAGEVLAVRFSSKGGLLASGGADGAARLWESSGEPRSNMRSGGSGRGSRRRLPPRRRRTRNSRGRWQRASLEPALGGASGHSPQRTRRRRLLVDLHSGWVPGDGRRGRGRSGVEAVLRFVGHLRLQAGQPQPLDGRVDRARIRTAIRANVSRPRCRERSSGGRPGGRVLEPSRSKQRALRGPDLSGLERLSE